MGSELSNPTVAVFAAANLVFAVNVACESFFAASARYGLDGGKIQRTRALGFSRDFRFVRFGNRVSHKRFQFKVISLHLQPLTDPKHRVRKPSSHEKGASEILNKVCITWMSMALPEHVSRRRHRRYRVIINNFGCFRTFGRDANPG
jgi:hypothetical protein